MNYKCLNIGCGSRYNINWINIDIKPKSKDVIETDIQQGLDFKSNYFDVVYHSHIIEHLQKDRVKLFLDECYRVLKNGGIIRVVAPDLEMIAKTYLNCLDHAFNKEAGWDGNYDWVMLEMYDQITRTKSGGEMKEYLQSNSFNNPDFVLERCGVEAEALINTYSNKLNRNTYSSGNSRSNLVKLNNLLRKLMDINYIEIIKKYSANIILGDKYTNYKEYLEREDFFKSGELHRWMYDRFSLTRLLSDSGFSNICVKKAHESNIKDWKSANLDINLQGKIFKPDSIFIEAIKK